MKFIKVIIAFLIITLAPVALLAQELSGKLRMNQVQIIGSHNSYKQRIDTALFAQLMKRDSTRFKGLDYAHLPISQQLDLGLRQLEIDVYADVNGGKYAKPMGLKLTGASATVYDSNHVMESKGFKVLHVQDLDFRSSCARLMDCLNELQSWSNNHPNHLPIFITFNTKMDTIPLPGFVRPEAFTSEIFDLLDQEFVVGLGKDKIFAPDNLRGKFDDLPTAIQQKGWPTINKSKGKFVLILDEGLARRKTYLEGHPGLKNRMMFTTNAAPTESDAAIMVLNSSIENFNKIQEMVKLGFIVRTRADADTWTARKNDYTSFEKAKASGAQIISTDYYIKSQTFSSAYEVHFEGNTYQRINPLISTIPAGKKSLHR
jgi:hypothetical protein